MSEMVEKVARTIKTAHGQWDRSSEPDLYELLARAAIAAMREPTPEMIREGDRWEWPGGIWRHMVDAALEPVDDEEKRA